MGKRVKKMSLARQKEQRVSAYSPKIEPQQSDTIDHDGAVVVKERKPCSHIEKGFNLINLTEKLGSSDSLRCEDCRESAADKRGAKAKGKHAKKKGSVDSKAIWVCLECGHFACGGVGLPTTSQGHAVGHARQTHHPLVIQWEKTQLRWCFQCNSLIPVETTTEENGEKKDAFLDVVKLIKTQISEKSSVDVEEVWFGSGSGIILNEVKTEGAGISSSLEAGGCYTVRGMVNLGNTCFFNSVMQNLLAMDKLQEFFYNQDVSYGLLTISLKKLFDETKLQNGPKIAINPRSFFGCICSKAPQFRGNQQQDSHELLRCLLDGLSSEELAVRKQLNASREDESSLKEGPTFVDTLFGGRISSTVSCTECGHSSTVYEPYLDLSLPVPTKKPATKKIQPVCKQKKTKLPPKRGGKVRAKANKDTDTVPAQSISNCSESPSQTQLTIPAMENAEASSANFVSVANNNDLVSHQLPNVPSTDNEQVVDATWEELASSFDDFTWKDYLGPETISEEQGYALLDNDASTCQFPENMNSNNGAMESSHYSVNEGPKPQLDSSSVNPWEDEVPLQITGSEVLLLPYKEESFTDGGIIKGEDEAEFDGLGDLFNEPEVSSAPVAGPSLRTGGFPAAHSSESDPDEVDNSDSAVSVESCLAQFVKPELLSNDNAWECENCSKIMLLQRLEAKNKQARTVSKSMTNGGESLVSDNGETDCSDKNCRETEGGRTDQPKLNVQSNEQNSVTTTDAKEPSHSSADYKSFDQDSLSCPAVSSSSVEETSSTVNARDQLGDSQSSGNCEAEEDGVEDEERTSMKVKVKRDATKRVLVDKAPPILTVHLKRFSQDSRGRLSKLNGHVNFGDVLDLRPYMDSRCADREKYRYRLVGVVEHSGSMRGGHYVAYVKGCKRSSKGKTKNEQEGGAVWYHLSDTYVREASLEEVLGSEAYILFYQKI